MKYEIRHRFSGELLYSHDGGSMRDAVEAARKSGADLSRADLSGANLYGANLSGADLYGADLSGADLYGADLYGANLYGANLYGANLSGADLYGADLSRANLSGADLSRANLSGANLSGADLYGADLSRADLSGANLYGANLSGADLYGADLSGANLYGADLYGADLSRANLSGANLSGANLSGATGFNPLLTTPLYMLRDQIGPIRAYKLVNSKGEGPFNGGITYKVGKSYEVSNADTNEQTQCGAGINLATLDWCLKEWREGYRVLVVEHLPSDIAAIPVGSDGKYRVHRCKVVGEKTLAELGLEKPAEVKQESDRC